MRNGDVVSYWGKLLVTKRDVDMACTCREQINRTCTQGVISSFLFPAGFFSICDFKGKNPCEMGMPNKEVHLRMEY